MSFNLKQSWFILIKTTHSSPQNTLLKIHSLSPFLIFSSEASSLSSSPFFFITFHPICFSRLTASHSLSLPPSLLFTSFGIRFGFWLASRNVFFGCSQLENFEFLHRALSRHGGFECRPVWPEGPWPGPRPKANNLSAPFQIPSDVTQPRKRFALKVCGHEEATFVPSLALF